MENEDALTKTSHSRSGGQLKKQEDGVREIILTLAQCNIPSWPVPVTVRTQLKSAQCMGLLDMEL